MLVVSYNLEQTFYYIMPFQMPREKPTYNYGINCFFNFLMMPLNLETLSKRNLKKKQSMAVKNNKKCVYSLALEDNGGWSN